MARSLRSVSLALFGSVIAVAVLATGCSSGTNAGSSTPSKKEVKNLSYIVKFGSEPYFVAENKGVQAKSAELGINTTKIDVKSDANAALSAVDTSIAQGTQGLAVVVPDQKIGPAVISKTKAAGIPIVAIDDPIKDGAGNPAPFVGFDSVQIGTQVGEKLAELVKAAGIKPGPDVKIASIEDQKTPICMDRNNAAQKAFQANFPGFSDNNIIHVPYGNDLNSAIDAMNPTITSNPGVKKWILYSCNDAGVLGAWRALSTRGVPAADVFGVGINGDYACQELGKGAATGFRGSYYTDSAKNGQVAIQELYEFLHDGKPIPVKTTLPGQFVDSNNYKTVIGC